MLAAPGALEREIGILIAERAWRAAQRLLDNREQPGDGETHWDPNGLWERAVTACYRQLQRQVMRQSAQIIRELPK